MASSTFVLLTCSVLLRSIILKTKAVVRERDDGSVLSRTGQRQESPTRSLTLLHMTSGAQPWPLSASASGGPLRGVVRLAGWRFVCMYV